MKTRKLGWMLLGVASLACSGRYNVGGMDATGGVGGNRGAAGGAAPGGASPSAAGVPVVGPGGDAGNGTPGGIAPDCLEAIAPEPLSGPFAEPAVVWRRVAMLTGGDSLAPPQLPAETSYEWAAGLVPMAIANAHLKLGTAPGVETFLRQWLRLAPDAPFVTNWGALVPVPTPVLQTLLSTTAKPNRTGIFTEPSWLAKNTNISTRGVSIERSLFGTETPPAPLGRVPNPEPNPNLTDRQALETEITSPTCSSCHRLMDPSGFALGHFAADGSYRRLDHDQPIDPSGSRFSRRGDSSIEFDGIADFGQKFANTCEATLGFSDAFLSAVLVINQAPAFAQDDLFRGSQARVQQAFINGGRTYHALVTGYIQSPAGLRP